MTTFRQHLHASDMGSPNWAGEGPPSIFNKFTPNGLMVSSPSSQTWAIPSPSSQGWRWKGRKGEPALPSLPTGPALQSTAHDPWAAWTHHGCRMQRQGSSGAVAALPRAEPTRCHTPSNCLKPRAQHRAQAATSCFSPSSPGRRHLLPRESKKPALFSMTSARCLPGLGMNRHMDKHQKWMKKHSISLRIIY